MQNISSFLKAPVHSATPLSSPYRILVSFEPITASPMPTATVFCSSNKTFVLPLSSGKRCVRASASAVWALSYWFVLCVSWHRRQGTAGLQDGSSMVPCPRASYFTFPVSMLHRDTCSPRAPVSASWGKRSFCFIFIGVIKSFIL